MRRLQGLDLLRAVAILLVLVHHMPRATGGPALVLSAHRLLVTGGWVGVDLFFVLSGFLVSSLLFEEEDTLGAISFRRFFLRRGFKIYPSYWVLLVVGWAWFGERAHFSARDYLINFAFLQNYIGRRVWGVTWSLCVEEHFYVLLPLLLIALRGRGKSAAAFRWLPWICLATAVGCLIARFITAAEVPYSPLASEFPTHLRIDSLMFGVALSFLRHRYPAAFERGVRRLGGWLPLAGVALLLPAFWFDVSLSWVHTVGYTVFYLGSGMLVAWALSLTTSTRRLMRGLAFLGTHSYSIYLWHTAVNMLAVRLLVRGSFESWLRYGATYLSASIALGIVMAKVVEFPLLRLRDRWLPSRASSPSAAPF
jgi:peptidoglycan/LPS O-acetylase OafA/YrhL